MEFVCQSSKHQFNHQPTGGSKTTAPTETLLKDVSHQFNHPPEGGRKNTASMETRLKDPTHQLYQPFAGSSKNTVPVETQFTDLHHHFNHLPIGGSKAAVPQDAQAMYSYSQINPSPVRGIKTSVSMGAIPQKITHNAYKPAMLSTQEPNQCTGIPQTNNDQGNLLSIMQQQNDITALLVQQHSSLALPPREIPTFDGDPLKYNAFIRAFELGVERKAASSVDCLYFLEQYTKGQPQELVKSCQHMPPDKRYQRAKILLQERFGNEQRVATAYMEKALGWSPIKSEDIKALQAFALFLRVCSNAMEDVSYMSEMNMPSNMRAIILKLPYRLREKWRNTAY